MVINLDRSHAGPESPRVALPVFKGRGEGNPASRLRPFSVKTRVACALKLGGKTEKRYWRQTSAAGDGVIIRPINRIDFVGVPVGWRLFIYTERMSTWQALIGRFGRDLAVVDARLLYFGDVANAEAEQIGANVVG